jgi:peroxiredoxin
MISLLATICIAQAAPKAAQADLVFKPTGLDWEGNKAKNRMYRPRSATPVSDGVYKIELGNGPEKEFSIRVQQDKFQADLNRNGNFDDDAAATVRTIGSAEKGNAYSYQTNVVFPASYTDGKKNWKAPYGINFYWFEGRKGLNYFRSGLATGTIQVGSRKLEFDLAEDASNGIFGERYDTVEDPTKANPGTLTLQGGYFDPRGTIIIDGVNYLPEISVDGRKFKLTPTYRVVTAPKPAAPAVERKLIAVGAKAPDFTIEKFEGGSTKLSSYLGKVVILKFWATWCGPCKASMPHFQEVYEKIAKQDVELLAVCVADEKELFQKWVSANNDKYKFPFSVDPAGNDRANGIHSKLYGVSGIPTVFIIDREGKISSTIVGYSGPDDHRVEEALRKLDVKI